MDLHDWDYFLQHPEESITNTEILYLRNGDVKLSDFEIVNVIRVAKPKSIRNLFRIMNKDLSTIQPKVKRLAEEGLIRLENGPKNSKVPIVNYNKIAIEV